jgi:thiol-disulfide isomerase/thioredoxin
VVRGFTDLRAIEEAEAWQKLRHHPKFLKLQDAVPSLLELEAGWPAWDEIRALDHPGHLDAILRRSEELHTRVTAMEPALGERGARLWHRMVDRATATVLDAWVAANPGAEGQARAIARLLELYAGSGALRWKRPPAEVAARLTRIGNEALEREARGNVRAAALVARALGSNAVEGRRNRLTPESADAIRTSLREVVDAHPDAPVLATAIVGLVRTDLAVGRWDDAAAAFRAARERHGSRPDVWPRVRRELGELALRLGGLPPFRVTALDGTEIAPESLGGKVAVIDFWATWCGPCVDELPTLRAIEERHGQDVVLVGVNLDDGAGMDEEALRAWIGEHGVPGRQIHDGEGWRSELAKAFGVHEIPFVVVVDKKGNVVAVNEHGRKLEKAVQLAAAAAR